FPPRPCPPSTVEPTTDIFQVVMLSASLNFKCARPCLSVSIWGCQSSVSGKYSRKRGVAICCDAPAPGSVEPARTTSETDALVSNGFNGLDMTDTISVTPPTWSVASTFVNFEE